MLIGDVFAICLSAGSATSSRHLISHVLTFIQNFT
jgi:hypothetical protein